MWAARSFFLLQILCHQLFGAFLGTCVAEVPHLNAGHPLTSVRTKMDGSGGLYHRFHCLGRENFMKVRGNRQEVWLPAMQFGNQSSSFFWGG